ncbi:hypothetical protein DFH06DRAFT_549344 [Mycena polygramma]|nr:hypothetical protein DFH06DRAFT_549344 [Mycena polygramma]
MGFWTVVGWVAAALVLDLVLSRDENGSSQDEGRHDYYQPTPRPQPPPAHGTAHNTELQRQAPPVHHHYQPNATGRAEPASQPLAPQHHYQATYGTNRNAEPARQHLAPQPPGALERQLTAPASNVIVRPSSQTGDQPPRTWVRGKKIANPGLPVQGSLVAENSRLWQSTSGTSRDAEHAIQCAAPPPPNLFRKGLATPTPIVTARPSSRTGDQPPHPWSHSGRYGSTYGTSCDAEPLRQLAAPPPPDLFRKGLATPTPIVTARPSSRTGGASLLAERSNRNPESVRQPNAPQQDIFRPQLVVSTTPIANGNIRPRSPTVDQPLSPVCVLV